MESAEPVKKFAGSAFHSPMFLLDKSVIVGVCGGGLTTWARRFDANAARVIALLTIISLIITIVQKLRAKKAEKND